MTPASSRPPQQQAAGAEVTHLMPGDEDGGLMPCCRLTPFEVPRTDQMTSEALDVTCDGSDRSAER